MSKLDDKVLNTAKLSRFLAVSQETVARWCQGGRLPAFKIGGQWRVRQSDLQKVIQGKIDKGLRKREDAKGKPLF